MSLGIFIIHKYGRFLYARMLIPTQLLYKLCISRLVVFSLLILCPSFNERKKKDIQSNYKLINENNCNNELINFLNSEFSILLV